VVVLEKGGEHSDARKVAGWAQVKLRSTCISVCGTEEESALIKINLQLARITKIREVRTIMFCGDGISNPEDVSTKFTESTAPNV
jgi:hypothetical protein